MGCSPPICLHEGFEKVYNNYLFETVLVDGTMFFSDVLQSKPTRRKKKAGGLGGGGGAAPLPFANTTSLSRVLRGSIWLLFLLAG